MSKYIHIHIPKTAGCYIKRIIEIALEENKDVNIINPLAHITDEYSKPLKFHPSIKFVKKAVPLANEPDTEFVAIVRNPYDRIFSLWKYFRKLNVFGSLLYPYVPEQFDDYIDELKSGEYNHYYHMNSQLFFIEGNEPNRLTILKFEEMNTTVRHFLEQNGVKWQDFKLNDIPSKPYSEIYSPKTADVVRDICHKEFEAFGYPLDL